MSMNRLRIEICDDKKEDLMQIRNVLCSSMTRFAPEIQMEVTLFTEGIKLYECSKRENYDLVFLDIEMPVLDGFELARRLCMEQPQLKLIFVSNHESRVFDSYEYMPLWFIRKRQMNHDMDRALKKYLETTSYCRITYRIREGLSGRDIPVRQILYLEGSGHDVWFHLTDGGEYRLYGSLKAVEKEIEKYGFLRIHKSYLVNQAYIEEIGRLEVRLKNGRRLAMGRDRKKKVEEAVDLYRRERG